MAELARLLLIVENCPVLLSLGLECGTSLLCGMNLVVATTFIQLTEGFLGL